MAQEMQTLKAELALAEEQLAHVNELIAGQLKMIEKWKQQNPRTQDRSRGARPA